MTLELSDIMFTKNADVIPPFGVEDIVNTGVSNTLAGNDIIKGDSNNTITTSPYSRESTGLFNSGTLNTSDGNDILTGIFEAQDTSPQLNISQINGIDNAFGGTIDTGNGNDIIQGIIQKDQDLGYGLNAALLNDGTIYTDNGNDIIEGTATLGEGILFSNNGVIDTSIKLDTGRGNDIIAGTGTRGLEIYMTITTGEGNDTISGTGFFGEGFYNAAGSVYTGDGNDIISGASKDGFGISNGNQYRRDSIIDTGDGNDVITGIGSGGIYNGGIIKTGNGNDSIIADGGNYLDFHGEGSVFLENGKDFLRGFGRGIFNGGNGEDTLELTPGSYTVGISGTTVNFFASQLTTTMQTSDFEILIAGGTRYDFSSLTDGQIITIPYPSI